MSLNFKHRLFLHHYLGDAKGDPVKAARLAGYSSPEKAAPVLLRNSTIASYLEQKLEEAGALPVAEILARYSAVATFDILEYVDFVDETNKAGKTTSRPVLDLKALKKAKKGHIISDIKFHPSGAVEIKLHDADKALGKLAQIRGMLKERIEITNVGGDIGNDRIIAIIGGYAQLSGANGSGEAHSEREPGGLCDSFEQREMEASPALEVDQSTLALGGPGCDQSPDFDARPKTREESIHIGELPGLVDRQES